MRFAILALLARGAAHGYELKLAYESRFGAAVAPVNIGQVYTTLARLERDGLVQAADVAQDDRPNKRVYSLTGAGREALQIWLDEPAVRPRIRDEFAIKLILAGMAGLADPAELIERQRKEYLEALRDLDGLARQLGAKASLAEQLIIEGASLHLEADLKWLDFADDQVERMARP